MTLIGHGRIACAMGIWSTWGLFVRWLGLPGWAITFYVAIVACAVALAVHVGSGKALYGLWPRTHRGALTAMGLLFLVNNVCFLAAYAKTTVANAALTHYTAPLFVAVLAPLLLKERILPTAPLALTAGCVGLVLLLPGARLSLSDQHLQGLTLGTASGAAYAGLILFARHLSLRVPPLQLIFVQNLIIAACLMPWAMGLGLPLVPDKSAGLLLLGIVHATVGGWLYVTGIRTVRALTASILGYLEPLGAVLLAALFLGESLKVTDLLGGVLILLGGTLVVWDESRQKAVDAFAGHR